MVDHAVGALVAETALGFLPILLQFRAIPLPILLGDFDKFAVVAALLVLLIGRALDVIAGRETHQIVDFMTDDAHITARYALNLECTLLQQPLPARLPDTHQELVKETAEVDL